MNLTRRQFLAATSAATLAAASGAPAPAAAKAPTGRRTIPARSVIPAALTPFGPDLQIARREFRRHLTALAAVRGVTAIMVNGAAGEDSALSRDERRAQIAEAAAAVGDRVAILAAVRELKGDPDLGGLARDAAAEGAHAFILMPPADKTAFEWPGAEARLRRVLDAAGLPVAVYHTNYATETLVRFAAVPAVFAIKEGGGDPATFAQNLPALRAARSDLAVWTTNSRWLLADLAVGADGILSGMGSVTADWHVELAEAVGRSDLVAARRVHERMQPLVRAFYRPGQNAHARMKYALALLGRIQLAQVRPPLKPLDAAERQIVTEALRATGLLA